MALRVPKAELGAELSERLIGQFGTVPEPVEVMWHNPKVAGAAIDFGGKYAEAMTNTPPTVTDELSARLLDRLGPSAMIELTAFIAFSNLSTRGNVALGIESQGFSAACEVPLAARPERAAA